jgi:hypothetical protein
MVSIPLYIRHHISFKEVGGGKIEIQIGPKQTMGKLVNNSSNYYLRCDYFFINYFYLNII